MQGITVNNDHKLELSNDIPYPQLKKNEVIVNVKYTTINSFDLELAEGKYDLFTKLSRSTSGVKTGIEFSGIVETDGKLFSKGERVFGYVDMFRGNKTHAQYISVPEHHIAHVPDVVDLETAASLPMSALTAFVALYEKASLSPTKRVLINGASGGVGVYTVQVAKFSHAHITAVGGTDQQGPLRSLGADVVYDYHQTDITGLNETFDVIFDLANTLRFSTAKHLLNRGGTFIPALPDQNILGFIQSRFSSKKSRYLMVMHGDTEKLDQIASWVVDGKLKTSTDQCYPIADYSDAFQQVRERKSKGKIILKI